LPGVVSVASPASRYLAAVLEALAPHRPSARVLVAAGRGGFGHHAAQGLQQAAARLGVPVVDSVPHDEVPETPDADVLLMAGTFEQDVALLRRLRTRPPVVAAVAAGLGAFANELGRRADGVLAPSQWEEGVHFAVDVGPRPANVVRALRARVLPTLSAGTGTGHVEYPSAQAYAAVLVALHCVEDTGSLDDEALGATARRLRCTTFFGRFGLGDDGRQLEHDVLVVQWRAGVKRIVWPAEVAETELDENLA
jgi:branched-chain amino acid transport system substrate-binding protein